MGYNKDDDEVVEEERTTSTLRTWDYVLLGILIASLVSILFITGVILDFLYIHFMFSMEPR